MTCRCLVRQRARIAPKKTCTAFVLPIRDLKGFLRFLRKTTNTLETLVNAGFACVLGKFEHDCLGGRNLRVWFESYLRNHSRKASGTALADRVRVEIEFDPSYKNGPQHPMPRWFKQALTANPQASENWRALIPSRKKEVLRYLVRLSSPDARARNLAKAIHVLSGETGRFIGRAWRNGS